MKNLTDFLLSRLKTSAASKAVAYDPAWFNDLKKDQSARPADGKTSRPPSTWQSQNWETFIAHVRQVAAGLLSMGLKKGHRFVGFCPSHLSALVVETAAVCVGAVWIPVSPFSSTAFLKNVLQKSHAAFLLVPGQKAWESIIESLYQLTDLQHVITLFPVRGDAEMQINLEVLEKRGFEGLKRAKMFGPDAPEGDLLEHASRSIEPHRDAYIIHSMGSTGEPRPIPITHGSLLEGAEKLGSLLKDELPSAGSIFEILPQGHFCQCISWGLHIALGYELQSYNQLHADLDNVASYHPQILFTIPQTLEHFFKQVWKEIRDFSGIERKLAEKAFGTRPAQSSLATLLAALPVDRLIRDKVRKLFGNELHTILSTGSSLRPDLVLFFQALGIKIIDIYGLAEAGGAVAIGSPIQETQQTTLGTLLPDFDLQLTNQMEIQISGKRLCPGYGYSVDEVDRQEGLSFKGEWLQTGDIGQPLEDRRIVLLEHKKDILITAAGKIIYPRAISCLFSATSYVEHAIVFGHNQAYLSVLVTLDQAMLANVTELKSLLKEEKWFEHPIVLEWFGKVIGQVNQALQPYEQIKKFAILPEPLSVEKGELNLLLEPVRKKIQEKYAPILERFYVNEQQSMGSGGSENQP